MNSSLTKTEWEKLRPKSNPFLSFDFFHALVQSQSIGKHAGWDPLIFSNRDQSGLLYTFQKNHSYGEYIFDWGWAQAYEKHGLAYYPKLVSMTPFTPVTTSPFLMPIFDENKATELLKQYEETYLSGPYSSSHFLFIDPREKDFFSQNRYMIRESMQYHFFNENYADFDAYLNHMKSRKAKVIRKERIIENVRIKQFTGDQILPEHALRLYQFYLLTIDKKNSYDYLNENFFKLIFDSMKANILYVEAYQNEQPIAGSLFFFDEFKIYGRYWGSTLFVENLHFEMCYYQGIDFCLKNKLRVFEAGAQGEHKIARGFRPTVVYSAHKIKHPGFHSAIDQFIKQEKIQIHEGIKILSEGLPFRTQGPER